MRINLTSIPVEDQAKALSFYTEKLGFVKKEDVPMGEHRWLTVTSPEDADGVELLLEPLGFDNTYTLTMKRERARELGVASISDLARLLGGGMR